MHPNRFFVSRPATAPSVQYRRQLSKTADKKEAALLRYTPESASTKAPSQVDQGRPRDDCAAHTKAHEATTTRAVGCLVVSDDMSGLRVTHVHGTRGTERW